MSRVTFFQTLRPRSVNSKETIGCPLPPAPLSKFCSGFLMSVPRSATLSARTYQRSLFSLSERLSFC
jgi:hypothetical protein